MNLHRVFAIPMLIVPLFAAEDLSERFRKAIRNHDVPALKELLKGGNVETRDSRGTTPLMHAAAFGNAESLKLLLDAHADVNARNSFDATALIWAAGDPLKSRILIEHGASVLVKSQQGRTPLMLAAKRDGGSSLVRLMLAKGADPLAKDRVEDTALMIAALTGEVESMRLLIAAGADVNSANVRFGNTPLMNAVWSNNVEAVRLLLSRGADVNAATSHQVKVRNGPIAVGELTALMYAAPYGSPRMIETLLRAGAHVNARDIRGMTALILAVASETQDVRVVELLLKGGAEVNVANNDGETALDWAKKFGDREVMTTLQKAGAKGTARSSPSPSSILKARRDAREAVKRAIELLQRSSTEYFKQSGCVGCHHQPMTAMAVRTARLAGIPVNEDTSREQMNVMRSQAASGQEAYLQGMDQGNSNTPVSLLEGLAAAGYAPDTLTDSIVSSVVALQRLDGSWRRGQTAPRPPIEESDISRTALALRTLQVYSIPARSIEFGNRVRRAREWLLKAKPRTTDERVMVLLGLAWAGAPKEKIKKAADALVAFQRGDGGWAGNPNLASDAFSTGEALYALRESASIQVGDLVYQRGARFLLETQFEDGSWYVRSRAVKFQPYFQSGFPFEHDQWISAAGTAWASVALAATIGMQNASVHQ